MRSRQPFTVFPRTLASGRVVFYYQCYDGAGRRANARSTGQVTRAAAIRRCVELVREARLVPPAPAATPATAPLTFGEFARDWWTGDCPYLQWRGLRRDLAASTVRGRRYALETYLLPAFGATPLEGITAEGIEAWLVRLLGTRSRRGAPFKASTVNQALACLRIMLGEAARRGLLEKSPADQVRDLKAESKRIEILTLDEARRLFPPDWERVWESYLMCALNKLAMFTGMRLGELLGLRCSRVARDHISVAGQFVSSGTFERTKTRTNRDIPITGEIREGLEPLIAANGAGAESGGGVTDGYVFSDNGGRTPVCRSRIYRAFGNALARIGIGEAERARRGLSLHGWRHFLNTRLRLADISDAKVQMITGHRTRSMTDRYTHFNTREFVEVREVQEGLLG